ncbi:uncharacterized protein [Typha angustifolia]|uniref:uncharacterized protein isoform X3 n=1 Tax=Typha angustifolia TaxID=59011 RepID=UPI003C30CA82
MVERFFSTRQLGGLVSVQPLVLLSGPPCCGKTSLLFQFAINCASESNRDVVFICNKRKLENKPPFLSQGLDPSSDVLQRIQIKNCQLRYGNARGRDLGMVHTLALCQDAIIHANGKMQPAGSCTLLLADTHQGDTPRLLFIYKRWINCIFTIQGDGSGSYIIKNSSISGSTKEKTKTARYSIALQNLVLEEIVDE